MFIPLTPDVTQGFRWTAFDGYTFAEAYRTAPVVAAEIHQIGACGPIVFEATDTVPQPAVLLTLGAASLIRAGQWTGTYVPCSLRMHPFGATSNSEAVLYDPDSLCLSNPDGMRAVDQTGAVTEDFRRIKSFVGAFHRFARHTERACRMLAKAELFIPARDLSALDHEACEGLFVIDRARLAKLPQTWLAPLHSTGALEIAYAHLTSLGTLANLRRTFVRRDGQAEADKGQGAAADNFLSAMGAAYGSEAETDLLLDLS
ncbi:SapC family protein [Sagittula sp. SSi028]|uniref:SapC family protein n=1 Tax=Sagittula sp. SSi028 TaxID=3400636 RepID=UPI003AF9BF9D